MRWWKWLGVGVVVVAGVLTYQNLKMPKSVGLVDGKLHPCPKASDCVCCCHSEPQHYVAPLPYASAMTLDQIEQFVKEHYSGTVVEKTPTYLHMVATTGVFHWKDDMEFMALPEKGRIRVRSASRVDFFSQKRNRAQVEAIRSFLESRNSRNA